MLLPARSSSAAFTRSGVAIWASTSMRMGVLLVSRVDSATSSAYTARQWHRDSGSVREMFTPLRRASYELVERLGAAARRLHGITGRGARLGAGARRHQAKFGMSTSMHLASDNAHMPNLAWSRLAPAPNLALRELSYAARLVARAPNLACANPVALRLLTPCLGNCSVCWSSVDQPLRSRIHAQVE